MKIFIIPQQNYNTHACVKNGERMPAYLPGTDGARRAASPAAHLRYFSPSSFILCSGVFSPKATASSSRMHSSDGCMPSKARLATVCRMASCCSEVSLGSNVIVFMVWSPFLHADFHNYNAIAPLNQRNVLQVCCTCRCRCGIIELSRSFAPAIIIHCRRESATVNMPILHGRYMRVLSRVL